MRAFSGAVVSSSVQSSAVFLIPFGISALFSNVPGKGVLAVRGEGRIVLAASGAVGDCKQISVMKEEALKRLSDVTYVVSSQLAWK